MPEPRQRKPARPAARPPRSAHQGAGGPSGWRTWADGLRPDVSWRGLRRLGIRTALACGTVGLMAVLATWSASGFLDRGGIDRLISMRNTPEVAATAQARRGFLDRGRLKAVIAAGGQ